MIRFLMVALSLWTAARPASAQELALPTPLSLEAAVRLARERNPNLASSASLVDAARAGVVGARLRPNPAFTIDTENYPLFDPNRPNLFNNQQLTIRMDQEVELGGRRMSRLAVAQSAEQAEVARLRDAGRRLELEVRQQYLAVALADADLEVARNTLEEIDRVIGLNRVRHDEGEISGVEVRRIQVERLRFVEDVFTAQLAQRNARGALLALLNAPDLSVPFDLADGLTPDPLSSATARSAADAVGQAVAVRPDLVAARHEVQRAESQTRLQRALRTPNVTVGGGYQRNFGADAFVFGVTVPLPLRNRNEGGVAQAQADEARARHLLVATTVQVRLDIQQAINATDVSQARVAYIEREYLGPAREARDIVLQAYRLGTADLIDFLDAQRAFRDTLRTYNRALHDRRSSVYQLSASMASGEAEVLR